MIRKVLTIAGSDTLSAGGLQADLKTFEEFGVFGVCSVTCIVTINDDQLDVELISPELLQAQLQTIKLHQFDAIKLGMLADNDTILQVKQFLLERPNIPVVTDPVFAFKETNSLLDNQLALATVKELFPLTFLTTPNLIEAQILADMAITNLAEMKIAAKKIHELGPKNVLVKGGQRIPGAEAIDVWFDGTDYHVLTEPKLESNMINGAGCTLAAAITAGLSKGLSTEKAILTAKSFVFEGIKHGFPFLPELGNVWQGAYRQVQEERS